jgi:hypothetical protein
LWNQIFARDLWKSARWCRAKLLADFTLGIIDRHSRSVGALHTKEAREIQTAG